MSTPSFADTRWALGTTWLLAALVASSAAGQDRQPRRPRITGSIELNGCEIQPREITLRAEALEPVLPEARPPEGGRRGSKRAFVFRTRDPHVARFVVLGLEADTLYRLRIDYPRELCGKVFWRGPFQGFAVPGGEPVTIEGFAARTEVEVFDEVADAWVGAAALDFDSADGGGTVKRFRWRSSLPGVTGGELQIAARAFPTKGDFRSCEEPEAGVFYRSQVPARGNEWVELPAIDFAQVLVPDGEPPPGDGRSLAELDATVQPLDVATLRDVAMGAPLYVRVAPETAAGPACDRRTDGVQGWALVARVRDLENVQVPDPTVARLEPGNGHFYAPPFTGGEGEGYPTYGQQGYKIIGSHTVPPSPCIGLAGALLRDIDPLGCTLIDLGIAPGSVAPLGAWFYFAPMSSGGGGGLLSSITSSFSSLVTGTVTAVGFAINAASELYEDIKTAVKDVALDAINAVPGMSVVCANVDCEAIVEAGMTAALAAAGMPPSLPNVDQLKQQGIEYAASQIASQTGVPPELAEKALEVAENAMEDMLAKRGSSDPKYGWVLPYAGFEPAYVEIVLKKNDANPLPANLVLARATTPLFQGGVLPIPSAFPASGELRIPMVLRPNISQMPAPTCRVSLFGGTTCDGDLPPGSPAVCEAQHWDWQSKSYVWQAFDCEIVTFSGVSIYYRDRWVDALEGSACTAIATSSRLAGAYNFFLWDPPAELATGTLALVEPTQPLSWSGFFGSNCPQ